VYFSACIVVSLSQQPGKNKTWCGNSIALFSWGAATIPIPKDSLEPVGGWPPRQPLFPAVQLASAPAESRGNKRASSCFNR